MNKKLTYTQIGTLLHAILDIAPDEEAREEIVRQDQLIQSDTTIEPELREYRRLHNLATWMDTGILYGNWNLDPNAEGNEEI